MIKTIFRNFTIILISLFLIDLILHLIIGPPEHKKTEVDHPEFEYLYETIFRKKYETSRIEDNKIKYEPIISNNIHLHNGFVLPKSDNERNIFVIGGSIAETLSHKSHLFQRRLKKLFTGLNFNIIFFTTPGYDSYRVSLIAEEVFSYSPDLIIVLSGNNEFFDINEKNFSKFDLFRIKAKHFLSNRSYLYRGVSRLVNLYFERNEKSIPPFLIEKKRLKNYKTNLKNIIEGAKTKNIPLVLCTLPVNFKNWTINKHLNLNDKDLFKAWEFMESRDLESAEIAFKKVLQIDLTNASRNEIIGQIHANFFLGKIYEFNGNTDLAREYYYRALISHSIATGGNRCTPDRNKIIRQLSKENNNILVDIEKLFIKNSPNGLLGNLQFSDNCHWYYDINDRVFYEIVNSIINYYVKNKKPAFRYNFISTKSNKNDSEPINKFDIEFTAEFFKLIQMQFKTDHINYILENTIEQILFIMKSNPTFFNNEDSFTPYLINTDDTVKAAILAHIAESYRRIGQNKKSEIFIKKADTIKSDLFSLKVIQARINFSTGKIKKGLQLLKDLGSIDPDYPGLKHLIGKYTILQ